MNIDDMKLGDIKKLASLFQSGDDGKADILSHMIGKKVLIRDNMAGIFICQLEAVNGTQWRGSNGRKIHYWDKAGAVEGIAQTGVSLGESRITEMVPECNGQHQVQVLELAEGVYETLMNASVWNPK